MYYYNVGRQFQQNAKQLQWALSTSSTLKGILACVSSEAVEGKATVDVFHIISSLPGKNLNERRSWIKTNSKNQVNYQL